MSQDKAKKSTSAKATTYKYRKYDFKKRNRLIEMVQKQNKSLASSAKELGIAQTTARLIMKTWQEEGRVFQKKVDRIKREKKDALKLSQARKKEKQRQKKIARKQPLVIEEPEPPRTQIKMEESRPAIVEEPRIEMMPQIPFEQTMTFHPYNCQAPYFYLCPQPYFF